MLIDGPKNAACTLVLAHGAGAPMDSEFMQIVAERLAAEKIRVIRFEFPYMAARRKTGKKRPPDREPRLRTCWLETIRELGPPRRLVIGGKSLGGRIASLVADEAGAAGLICLGYPFHPTGKPDKLRIEHLKTLRTPALILQGQRDPFGKYEEVKEYGLPSRLHVEWLFDGDHSWKPRKASGRTWNENLDIAIAEAAAFAQRVTANS